MIKLVFIYIVKNIFFYLIKIKKKICIYYIIINKIKFIYLFNFYFMKINNIFYLSKFIN